MSNSAQNRFQNSSYFRLAGEQERLGNPDRALRIMVSALRDPTRRGMSSIITEGIERILRKCMSHARTGEFAIDVVHENALNPRTSADVLDASNPAPLISLTTISSRIGRVAQTIESITKQTVRPHCVNLYISEEPYLLDKGIDKRSTDVQEIIDLGANVYMVPNIGPYRKQYPIVHQLKGSGASPHTLIITIDDDVLYPPDLIMRLTETASFSDSVVAHRGREILFHEHQLGLYKSFGTPRTSISHLNLATGKNGIAYRLKHFPDDLGEYIGPYLAPTADDIWCKWVTGIRCIPTTIIEPRAAYDPSLDFPESAAGDKTGLFHAFNAKGTNDDAIVNLEAFFMFMRGVNLASLYGGSRA